MPDNTERKKKKSKFAQFKEMNEAGTAKTPDIKGTISGYEYADTEEVYQEEVYPEYAPSDNEDSKKNEYMLPVRISKEERYLARQEKRLQKLKKQKEANAYRNDGFWDIPKTEDHDLEIKDTGKNQTILALFFMFILALVVVGVITFVISSQTRKG